MGESKLAEMEPTHGTGGPARPMPSGDLLVPWHKLCTMGSPARPRGAEQSWAHGAGLEQTSQRQHGCLGTAGWVNPHTASTGCPHTCGSSTLTRAVHPTCNSVKSTKIELVEVSSFLKPPFQIQLVFYRMLVSWMRHTEDKISQLCSLCHIITITS